MKTLHLLLLTLIVNTVYSQDKDTLNLTFDKHVPSRAVKPDTLYKPNYPDGIYITKSDFINKTPSSLKSVNLKGLNSKLTDSIIHNCYFYYAETDKKIKDVFAISYQGHLYFQLKAILDNRNKTDRAQSTNFHNTFVRVIIGGDNYFYTEAELVNQWAAGTAANFGLIGGVIMNDLIKGKGIVWDFKNEEFNIFKSCKDYNEFIANKSSDDLQECKNHQPNMIEVRKTIEKLK